MHSLVQSLAIYKKLGSTNVCAWNILKELHCSVDAEPERVQTTLISNDLPSVCNYYSALNMKRFFIYLNMAF